MPLEPIGDIANPTLTDLSLTALTWETAADWDGAADEAGVVHEAFGELPGSDVVTIGYPSFDRGGSALEGYWPMTEASAPLADVTGNGHGMSEFGAPTYDNTGPFGRGAPGYDGANDYHEDGGNFPFEGGGYTVFGWGYVDLASLGKNGNYVSVRDPSVGTELQLYVRTDSGDTMYSFVGSNVASNLSWSDLTWASYALTVDTNGNHVFYKNAGSDTGGSSSVPENSSGGPFRAGYTNNADEYWAGRISHVRAYSRVLSGSEIQALHDAGTAGYLESATKSYNSNKQPDLANLSYSLNGGSIDLKVIGSPGTASEEVVTQTLDGATSYSLTWSNGHTDFRLRPEFATTTVTDTPPTFSAGSVQA